MKSPILPIQKSPIQKHRQLCSQEALANNLLYKQIISSEKNIPTVQKDTALKAYLQTLPLVDLTKAI